eukprot:TRINITY_DN5948_c0_g1_i10.p1 TRINITY_DN5948_c0_g1~~TRINITY_DN5948_c0_g1_i10.p1  ORF type:complete len:297 (-),score=64.20 TRINITY_DN5948_c0_g1_i10:1053-1943(-)
MRDFVALLVLSIFLVRTVALEEKIYTSFDGDPCVWLLDNKGGMGCHTSYGGVRGIMKYITNSTTLKKFNDEPEQSHKWILVVPAHLLADPVMINMLSSKTLSTISGILVLDGSRPSLPFSPAQKNPGSLEDKETEFYWNPKANGLLHKAIPVPLWRLDGEDAETILNMALYNANATDYPYFEAEITTFMQPDSTENSALCIRRETCRPIGGHSVYTPLVPLEITDVGDKNKMTKKEIIFLLSVLDSTSLFQKKTIGGSSGINAEYGGNGISWRPPLPDGCRNGIGDGSWNEFDECK